MLIWLNAFLLTQIVEMPIYVFGMGKEKPLTTRLAVAFCASALTHPIVWYIFPMLRPSGMSFITMAVAAEIFAVGVEALYLHWCRMPRPLLWAFLANAISVSIGLLIRFWGS